MFRNLFGGKVNADRRTAGNDPLPIPDGAADGRATLVPRRHRGVHRHLDGRRHGQGAERLRRNGLPLDGPRQRPFLRSAGPGVGRDEGRLPAPDQLVSVRHALHDVAREHLWSGEAARLGEASGGEPRLLRQRTSSTSIGRSLERRLEGVDRVGARVPAEEPRSDSPASDDAVQGCVAAGARVDLEGVLRRKGRQAVRRLQLSRGRRARRIDRRRDRQSRTDRRHQGAGDLYGDVADLRSGRAAALLHDRQRGAPRPGASRSAHAARPSS